MQSSLKKIGNSAGVVIPKPMLVEIGAKEIVQEIEHVAATRQELAAHAEDPKEPIGRPVGLVRFAEMNLQVRRCAMPDGPNMAIGHFRRILGLRSNDLLTVEEFAEVTKKRIVFSMALHENRAQF